MVCETIRHPFAHIDVHSAIQINNVLLFDILLIAVHLQDIKKYFNVPLCVIRQYMHVCIYMLYIYYTVYLPESSNFFVRMIRL